MEPSASKLRLYEPLRLKHVIKHGIKKGSLIMKLAKLMFIGTYLTKGGGANEEMPITEAICIIII